MDAAEVLAEAERRYWYDPVFHARVTTAVQIVALDCKRNTGDRLTRDEFCCASTAASVALVVAERVPTDEGNDLARSLGSEAGIWHSARSPAATEADTTRGDHP